MKKAEKSAMEKAQGQQDGLRKEIRLLMERSRPDSVKSSNEFFQFWANLGAILIDNPAPQSVEAQK